MSFVVVLVLAVAVMCFSLFIMSRENLGVGAQVSFESGLMSLSSDKKAFSVRFFALAVVFLLLDLETAFLLFSPLSLGGALVVINLCLLLMVWLYFLGTVYEWYAGSLSWSF
uniref:NADH-ubiquinone oxidoreductase chain 3 n=1 Tax=Echinorhynchus truttae TaxID=185727 RepID=K0JA65_9BILA|nr:NADH dehydrogenase subunit 3 [Echinorhynchus truttae]CCA94457.1 NADH dehydrogenase subunit 3 [Echinorhynchus truttae]